jgi:hypothetical protein
VLKFAMVSSASPNGVPMRSSCKEGSNPLGSIRGGEFTD